jgi:hypothetical protein
MQPEQLSGRLHVSVALFPGHPTSRRICGTRHSLNIRGEDKSFCIYHESKTRTSRPHSAFFYVLLTVHFSNIWFRVSNLIHSLFIISFHIPLHVSSHIVLIIRRIYCIYTTSGSLYVTLLINLLLGTQSIVLGLSQVILSFLSFIYSAFHYLTISSTQPIHTS